MEQYFHQPPRCVLEGGGYFATLPTGKPRGGLGRGWVISVLPTTTDPLGGVRGLQLKPWTRSEEAAARKQGRKPRNLPEQRHIGGDKMQ